MSTEPVPEDQRESIINRMDITIFFEEPARTGICCLSVDASGRIAIGNSDGSRKTIRIYNNEMTFLYALAFRGEGSFSILLTEEITWIIFSRSDMCVGVSSTGTVTDVLNIQHTFENTSILNHIFINEPIEVNGNIYELRNLKSVLNLTGEYSQAVVSYANGGHKVLYDAENILFQRQSAIIVAICFLFVVIMICVCYRRTESNENGTD